MPQVVLKNVRLSYPDLFTPGLPPKDSAPGTKGKYGAQFIFAPDSDAAKVAKAAFIQAAKDKWGANYENILKVLESSKKCLRQGDMNLDKDGAVRNGYADNLYLVARNKIKPVIVDKNKAPLTEDSGKPYGGCYVNVSVDIYPMDKPGHGKSINATLLAVQFAGDGEAFGGGVGSANVFGDLGDDEADSGADLF